MAMKRYTRQLKKRRNKFDQVRYSLLGVEQFYEWPLWAENKI